jgi:hypothetical protein
MPLAAARRCTELPSCAETPHMVFPGAPHGRILHPRRPDLRWPDLRHSSIRRACGPRGPSNERPTAGGIAASTKTIFTADRHNPTGTLAVHPPDFGALRRRRRRGVLAVLAALALVACLAWTITTLLGPDNIQSSVPRVTEAVAEPPETPKVSRLREVRTWRKKSRYRTYRARASKRPSNLSPAPVSK